jgi:tripartite-type tricarboxylate transporter receptor subunit TctC
MKSRRALLLLVMLVMLEVLAAPQAGAEDFYKGKTIKFLIGSGAGGGYDLFGRLMARHIGRYLPGEPAVAPQNMPGAGSVAMTNYIYNVAAKDGLSLGIGSPSLPLIDALETPGARFKVEKLNWIGRVSSITNVMATWHGSSIATIEDARKRDVLISAISATSPLTLLSRVMNPTTGTRFKLIRGYADSAATLLAIERGEVEGTTVSWANLKTTKAEWLESRKINIITQFSLVRYRELQDVPAAIEAARSPDDKRLLSLFVSGADVGYAAFTAPGVPPERIDALRRAFTAMTGDAAFQQDAQRLGIDLDPMGGEDLQKMIEGMSVFPDSVRERAKEVASGE